MTGGWCSLQLLGSVPALAPAQDGGSQGRVGRLALLVSIARLRGKKEAVSHSSGSVSPSKSTARGLRALT